MKYWEYKVIRLNSQEVESGKNQETELNLLGGFGWELVSVNCITGKTGAYYYAYFKKEQH